MLKLKTNYTELRLPVQKDMESTDFMAFHEIQTKAFGFITAKFVILGPLL